MIYYTIYKVTNRINGKYYIGKNRTKNLENIYMGSGPVIKAAIKKYGIENFTKEYLAIFDNEEEMNQAEKELISISDQTYNLCEGGRGGFDYINRLGLNAGANNVMHDPETKRKMSQSLKKTRSLDENYYNQISIKNLSKTWENNRGKTRPEHSEFMKQNYKKIFGNVDKEKIKDKISGTYEVIDPEGNSHITNRLTLFAEEHKLGFGALWNTSRTLQPVKKGKSKGWQCKILAR